MKPVEKILTDTDAEYQKTRKKYFIKSETLQNIMGATILNVKPVE